jgi:phosphoserine aminotransferase
MTKVKEIGENKHYNSLTFMATMMEKWQTPFTPNVLAIYLLMRVLEDCKSIRQVHRKIEERYRLWIEFFKDKKTLQHFISNEDTRSFTVIPVRAKETLVAAIKSRARKNGLLLGEGYGELNPLTFRIANFPAIKKSEIKILKEFLSDYD